MFSFYWIEKNLSFLTASMGIYRPYAGADFFFEPTADFYNLVSQGTTVALNEAMRQLAKHIEAPTAPIIQEWRGSTEPLIASDYDFANDKTPPGMIYYVGPGHSTIEVSITNKGSPRIMGSILAHELTHHFLESKGIRYPNVDENEKLTDLAASYLGLGKLTINGYQQISWMQKRGNQIVTHTYKVGYLSTEDVAKSLQYVRIFRNIPVSTMKQNLSKDALKLFDKFHVQADEYGLKKQLVGPRPCPHCENLGSFSFHDHQDGLYCSECGWEWGISLRHAYEKRTGFWRKLRSGLWK